MRRSSRSLARYPRNRRAAAIAVVPVRISVPVPIFTSEPPVPPAAPPSGWCRYRGGDLSPPTVSWFAPRKKVPVPAIEAAEIARPPDGNVVAEKSTKPDPRRLVMVALAPVLLPWKKTLPELSRTMLPAEALVLKSRCRGKVVEAVFSVDVPESDGSVLSNFGVKSQAKAGAGTAKSAPATSHHRRAAICTSVQFG